MTTKRIPLELLFGNPERALGTVSPDGKRIAYVAPVDGVLNVWVGAIDGGDAKPITDDRDRGIRAYWWAFDDRHLLYIQDKGGDENWHLYRVDAATGVTADLTPFEGVHANVIALSPRRPNELLVGLNRDNPAYHDVYRVDLDEGSATLQRSNPGFAAWVVDLDLAVRGAVRATETGAGFELCVPDGDDWRVREAVDFDDASSFNVFDTTDDEMRAYVLSSKDANAARLLRLDLASEGTEVLAEDPEYDVGEVVVHPLTGRPQIVGFLRDRLEHVVLDPTVADDLRAAEAIGRGEVHLQSASLDDRRWVVELAHDNGPASTYLFDRDDKSATLLFVDRPQLEQYELATMEPFQFEARDGLSIHGYLTYPVGAERSALPAILDVHGGPWSRDVWGFDPAAQWLANRGYLCVQVNYRGSSGYGKAFLNAGNKEWGAKMHDDLIDAIEWLVAEGLVARDRIGIFGGSYGGYAALAGAAFTPEVFCCAVDIVGPSNLKTLIESVPDYWAPMLEQLKRRVGDPETEEAFLWSRSPLSRASDIRTPLLIAQGANDPRVKQAESEQIVAALTANGIQHTYMLFPDEGHGFAKPENRLKFYAAVDGFLEEHMGGPTG
jgi:dipeptidyl aminopeptidase/acylaminoacyl peptidase